MQEHLKVRLTGAIILVVLVVSLVPEMFRGRPENRAAHGEASGDELPLRSYTIDLRNNAPPVVPAGAPPATGPAAAAPAAPAAQPRPADASPPQALPAAPQPQPQQPSQQPSQQRPQQPPKPPVAAHPAGHWVVQVGTFSRRDFAERMVKQLRAKGFAVVAAGPDDHGMFRVRSASLGTRAGAEALRQKMAQRGLRPLVSVAP